MRARIVADVMTTDVAVVRRDTPFKAVAALLASRRISAMPVLADGDKLVGVVSESDLLKKQEYGAMAKRRVLLSPAEREGRARASATTAAELMSSPAVTIDPEATLGQAARLMDEKDVKRLPVVDETGDVVGIVSRGDLLKAFLRSDEEIRTEIVEEILGRILWIDPDLYTIKVRDGVVTLTGELDRHSTVAIAVRLCGSVPGVVDVDSHLTYAIDDRDRLGAIRS